MGIKKHKKSTSPSKKRDKSAHSSLPSQPTPTPTLISTVSSSTPSFTSLTSRPRFVFNSSYTPPTTPTNYLGFSPSLVIQDLAKTTLITILIMALLFFIATYYNVPLS